MSNTLRDFLTSVLPQVAGELEAAYLKLPEDKRNWSPMGKARTAADMMAECAILNDMSEIIQNRAFPADFDSDAYQKSKDELAQNWELLKPLLYENAARTVAVMDTLSADDLTVEIPMPWGPYTLAEVVMYPYWNMKYHLGQINYIASILDSVNE